MQVHWINKKVIDSVLGAGAAAGTSPERKSERTQNRGPQRPAELPLLFSRGGLLRLLFKKRNFEISYLIFTLVNGKRKKKRKIQVFEISPKIKNSHWIIDFGPEIHG